MNDIDVTHAILSVNLHLMAVVVVVVQILFQSKYNGHISIVVAYS